jgi:hypothetical protein
MGSVSRIDRPKPWRARYYAPDGRQISKSFRRKIDGDISFEALTNSDRVEVCRDRDPYPSLEVYQFVSGQVRTVLQQPELPILDPSKTAQFSLSNRAINDVGCTTS